MKKKILSIFLAALTLCSVFAGCKDKSNDGSNSQDSITNSQDSTAGDNSSDKDGSSEEIEEVKDDYVVINKDSFFGFFYFQNILLFHYSNYFDKTLMNTITYNNSSISFIN